MSQARSKAGLGKMETAASGRAMKSAGHERRSINRTGGAWRMRTSAFGWGCSERPHTLRPRCVRSRTSESECGRCARLHDSSHPPVLWCPPAWDSAVHRPVLAFLTVVGPRSTVLERQGMDCLAVWDDVCGTGPSFSLMAATDWRLAQSLIGRPSDIAHAHPAPANGQRGMQRGSCHASFCGCGAPRHAFPGMQSACSR